VVVHCNEPIRDLILDLGLSGSERVSEFVTVLVQTFTELTGKELKVNFSDRIKYNNSRKKGAGGADCSLLFEGNPKVLQSTFKKGKNNENKVLFPAPAVVSSSKD